MEGINLPEGKQKKENILTPEQSNNIDVLFKNNPEYAKLWTSKEQYQKYLDTVFPDSKFDNIVWHGSNYSFNEFSKIDLGKTTGSDSSVEGFFFADNIDIAKHYANKEKVLTAYDKISLLRGDENFKLKKIEKELFVLKDKYFELEKNKPVFSVRTKILDFINKVFKGQSDIEKSLQLIDEQKNYLKNEIENLNSNVLSLNNNRNDLKEKLIIVKKIYNELGISESVFDEKEEHYIYNIEKYNQAYEEVSKSFSIPEYGKYTYPVLLDIKKPEIHNDKGNSKSFFFGDTIRKDKKSGLDATIIKNTRDPLPLDLYVVFNPEQIHILCSDQDIQKAKKWLNI